MADDKNTEGALDEMLSQMDTPEEIRALREGYILGVGITLQTFGTVIKTVNDMGVPAAVHPVVTSMVVATAMKESVDTMTALTDTAIDIINTRNA